MSTTATAAAPSPASSAAASPYPFATAPDIIRAHQKDAYFTGYLTNTLTDLHRSLRGARATHALAPELRAGAALAYLALTTLPGNRTLGEEYCDLVQLEGPTGKLPSVRRRAAYIAGTILVPYLASRILPSIRQRIRRLLERRLETLKRRAAQKGKDGAGGGGGGGSSRQARVCEYLLRNLGSLTSSAPVQAVTLAVFYFTGTYYELSKRLLSLRYVFTRAVPETPDRAGYEVLGVLLVVQLAVQGYLHLQSNLQTVSAAAAAADATRERSSAFDAGGLDVSLNHDNSYAANNDLLLPSGIGAGGSQGTSRIDIAAVTHTPPGTIPAYELTDAKAMAYIKGAQQRKCTLCLEELKDPSATQCGHVFCWECIGDWIREKPECPLCRREAMVQHILPLRIL